MNSPSLPQTYGFELLKKFSINLLILCKPILLPLPETQGYYGSIFFRNLHSKSKEFSLIFIAKL